MLSALFRKRIVHLLWSGYKIVLSPFFGNKCRFYPSCSQYSREAIEEHGWTKGVSLSIKRLLKCHPWHPGGIDLVPKKRHLGTLERSHRY